MHRHLPLALALAVTACATWRRSPPPPPDPPVLLAPPAARHTRVAGVPLSLTPIPAPADCAGITGCTTAIGVSLRLGHADDPGDRPGLGALLLALLRGPDERPGSLALALADLGGEAELVITQDGALIATEVASEHAPAALAAMIAALRRPADPASLPVIHAELTAARARARDDPDALALAALRRVTHPPGHPRARGELSAGTWPIEHVLEHQARALGPATLSIVAVGQLDPDALARAAAAALAGWSSAAAPPPPSPSFTAPARQALHLVARPGLGQAVIALGRAAPITDELAAEAAAAIVQSALHDRLRGALGLTYGVSVDYPLARGAGLLRILTEVDATAVAPALAEIQRTLAELLRSAPDPAVVARVCVHQALERMYQRQSHADLLLLAARQVWHDRPTAPQTACDALAPAVARALRAEFDPAGLQIVVVADPAVVAAPLARLGAVVRLAPADL